MVTIVVNTVAKRVNAATAAPDCANMGRGGGRVKNAELVSVPMAAVALVKNAVAVIAITVEGKTPAKIVVRVDVNMGAGKVVVKSVINPYIYEDRPSKPLLRRRNNEVYLEVHLELSR